MDSDRKVPPLERPVRAEVTNPADCRPLVVFPLGRLDGFGLPDGRREPPRWASDATTDEVIA